MQQCRDIASLRVMVKEWRRTGHSIGLVPTMGALHAGHLSLIAEAKRDVDVVVVSIFVNPKQFGPNEDFSTYPRQEDKDIELLKEHGVTLVYLPSVATMYPGTPNTTVSVTQLKEGLCGASRPGFFDGVALVVTKLFNQVQPDQAFFGEKDYQQSLVIRKLVEDLDFPILIKTVATCREPDGLAMSSRNAYLSNDQRQIAPRLYATLRDARDAMKQSPGEVEGILTTARQRLLSSGFAHVDYLELRDEETLELLSRFDRPARLLVAARLGSTRLIDTIAVLEKNNIM